MLLQNYISNLSTHGITEILYEFRFNRTVNASISITKTSPLKLFMGITALHSEDRMKYVNTPCGKSAQGLNFKVSGTVTTVIRSVRGQRLLYYIDQIPAVWVWYDYHNNHKIPLNSKHQPAFIMQMCECYVFFGLGNGFFNISEISFRLIKFKIIFAHYMLLIPCTFLSQYISQKCR